MKKITLLNTVQSVTRTFPQMLEKEFGKTVSVTGMLDEFLVVNAREKGYFPPENYRKLYLDLLSAAEEKPDAIVVTCSSLTPYVIELRNMFDMPIVTIDEAMCRDAAACGGRIAVLATAPTTVGPTVSRITEEAGKIGVEAEVISFLDTRAIELLNEGDVQGHDQRLVKLVTEKAMNADVIVLAQASMASAEDAVRTATGKKVLTSPGSCIEEVRRILGL